MAAGLSMMLRRSDQRMRFESNGATRRLRQSKRRSAPGIPTFKACAWLSRTGRRSCGSLKTSNAACGEAAIGKLCGTAGRVLLQEVRDLVGDAVVAVDSVHGVGPETADSILLYAGNHPVFVVDAYTRRILARHEILPENAAYEEIRELFERSLARVAESFGNSGGPVQYLAAGVAGAAHPPSVMSSSKRTPVVQVYNEMHGLIVGVGKNYCRKSQARCDGCPTQVLASV